MNPDKGKLKQVFCSKKETPDERLDRLTVAHLAPQDLILKFSSPSQSALVRADGSPIPRIQSLFIAGEHVVVKDYTFRVAYIGESVLMLEPVGPVIVGEEK